MFRMKFQSAEVGDSTSGDEEDERSGESSGRRCGLEPPVVHFEGKVVKVTKSRPLPSANNPFADGHASLRSLCPSAQVVPLPSLAAEGVHAPVPEIVIAKSNDGLMVETSALHFQDSIEDQAPKVIALQEGVACALLVDAKSDSESSECSTPTRRNEADDEALTEIINKIMEERKTTLQKNVANFTKPSEEPLLAAHDQEELDLKAKEEAKVQAKRIAEEERLERERDLRELRALAHCTTVGRSPGRSPTFKKSSKLKVILSKTGLTTAYRFLKSPLGIFRFRKKHTACADARAAKVVVPKASLFGGCRTMPSSGTTDSPLSMMREAPRPALTRGPRIQFATVESTQRDVPAWTREEYLRKNGRIPQNSTTSLKEDEELGGIQGNNFTNYFDDGIETDYDSDSD